MIKANSSNLSILLRMNLQLLECKVDELLANLAKLCNQKTTFDKPISTEGQNILMQLVSVQQKLNKANCFINQHIVDRCVDGSGWTKIPVKPRSNKIVNEVQKSKADSRKVGLEILVKNADSPKKHTPSAELDLSNRLNSLYENVNITSQTKMRALVINAISDVDREGVLFYIKPCDHFAIKIAGHTFHGNVGMVYADDANPTKVKECKYATSCYRLSSCGYYHDPTKHINSSDKRNFVANVLSRNKRILGSRDRIEDDIINISSEDLSRQFDYTMHNILVSLIFLHSKRSFC